MPPATIPTTGLKEKMLYILKAQEKNNQARIRELRARATAGFKEVFDLVPPLIHYNIKDLPGYLGDPDTPHGLVYYHHWQHSAERLAQCVYITGYEPQRPVVESLMLIGSSGSVGHTARSDLDYWVCYRPSVLNGERLDVFRQKLSRISEWALSTHGTEANFYLVDLAALAKGLITNDMNPDLEGEVAPKILLEEFYRTMILVAGRIPLWAIWPQDHSKKEYIQMAAIEAPLEWEETPPYYVDFGYPEKAAPQEYLAAAMWLTCKSEADPFKGILKIIPILEALETDFEAPLLCDTVKSEVIKNEDPNMAVDPYIITLERVMAFAASRLTTAQLNLIRVAAILKILGLTGKALESGENATDPAKDRLISSWIAAWHWPPEKLDHLLNYNKWPDKERLDQGYDLLLLLFGIYMKISNRLLTLYPGEVNACHNELIPFAARILGRQKGLESTVDALPSKFHRDSLSHELSVIQSPETMLWGVYDRSGDLEPQSLLWKNEKRRLHETKRAAKAAAWMIRNRLFGEDFSIMFLKTREDGLSSEAFTEYLEILDYCFPPFSFRSLDPDTIWTASAQGPVLVAMNFEDPQETTKLLSLDVVYRTGWGEIRHHYHDVSRLGVEADKYMALSELIIRNCGIVDASKMVNGTPNPSNSLKRAFQNIKGVVAASLNRSAQMSMPGSHNRIDLNN